jgi:uncharacterized RDD family membrane protein YckC
MTTGGLVSKCEKCGSVLRPEGDCPYCNRAAQGPPQVPPMLRPVSRPPNGPRTSAAPAQTRAPSTPPRVLTSPPVPRAQSNTTGNAGGKPPPLAGPAIPPRHPTPVPNRSSSPQNGSATARPVAPQVTPRPPTPTNPPAVARAPINTPPPSAESHPFEEDPAEILFRLPEPKRTPTPETVRAVRAQPAPIWRRFLAWMFDGCLILMVVAGYLRIAAAILGVKPAVTGLTGLDYYVASIRAWQSILFPGALLGLILALVYATIFAILRAGATPGRSLMRIHLVDRSGLSPTPARTVFRAILSTLSFATFLAGIWPALFDRHGRTFHDWLTSTFVVRLR